MNKYFDKPPSEKESVLLIKSSVIEVFPTYFANKFVEVVIRLETKESSDSVP